MGGREASTDPQLEFTKLKMELTLLNKTLRECAVTCTQLFRFLTRKTAALLTPAACSKRQKMPPSVGDETAEC